MRSLHSGLRYEGQGGDGGDGGEGGDGGVFMVVSAVSPWCQCPPVCPGPALPAALRPLCAAAAAVAATFTREYS